MLTAKRFIPRVSLRTLLLGVTVAAAALGWRGMCARQLASLQAMDNTPPDERTVKVLAAAAEGKKFGPDASECVDGIQVFVPESFRGREAVRWGLRCVSISIEKRSYTEVEGYSAPFLSSVYTVYYEADIRPWGLGNVRYDGDAIACY
ncbi:MAG: hypothetical protein AAF790_01670 [Planctomycetota bacterium]